MSIIQSGAEPIPQLDNLRSIAILLVIGLHYLSDAAHGPFGSLPYLLGSAFRPGWNGVVLFFVLLGFLIGGMLLEAHEASNHFGASYIRRFFRILHRCYQSSRCLRPLRSCLAIPS